MRDSAGKQTCGDNMGFFDVCGATTVFGEQICVLYKYIEREAVTCDACFGYILTNPTGVWVYSCFVFRLREEYKSTNIFKNILKLDGYIIRTLFIYSFFSGHNWTSIQ